MAITPKDLNQTNTGYGFKQFRHSWDANLQLLSSLQDKYDRGAYDFVIRDGIETLKGHGIKSVAALSKMHEAHLATFYFLGKSYLGLGQTDSAIACFQIVYSQHGFEKKMLTGPIDFAGLVSRAGAELQDIAQERGESYVNGIQVDQFMAQEFKGGCFIVTAAYGSPIGPELDSFRNFRDEVLLSSALGSTIVQVYYLLSPPLASIISRSHRCKALVRKFVLEPLLHLIRATRR
jgi:hypothetical protein